jgi:carbon storage regulator
MGMLVLKRRVNERVMIGDDVVVTVCEVGRGQVKIGFEAPATIRIDREEVYHRRAAQLAEEQRQEGAAPSTA